MLRFLKHPTSYECHLRHFRKLIKHATMCHCRFFKFPTGSKSYLYCKNGKNEQNYRFYTLTGIMMHLGFEIEKGLSHAKQGIIGFRTSLISFLLDVGLARNLNRKKGPWLKKTTSYKLFIDTYSSGKVKIVIPCFYYTIIYTKNQLQNWK